MFTTQQLISMLYWDLLADIITEDYAKSEAARLMVSNSLYDSKRDTF